MHRIALGLSLLVATASPAVGQMGCRDLASDELETYSKAAMIFTVDHPSSMSWVLEPGETKVKFRAMPPQMVGFIFSHDESTTTPERFASSVAGWSEAFQLDYGGTPVQVYAAPENQGTRAEYKALLPHGGAHYALYAALESASPECDYAAALEGAIRTIKPNPGTTR